MEHIKKPAKEGEEMTIPKEIFLRKQFDGGNEVPKRMAKRQNRGHMGHNSAEKLPRSGSKVAACG